MKTKDNWNLYLRSSACTLAFEVVTMVEHNQGANQVEIVTPTKIYRRPELEENSATYILTARLRRLQKHHGHLLLDLYSHLNLHNHQF